MMGKIKVLGMFLIYGVLIGVPASIITTILVLPITAASGMWSPLGILGMAIGYTILGWWARLVVRRIHIFGG